MLDIAKEIVDINQKMYWYLKEINRSASKGLNVKRQNLLLSILQEYNENTICLLDAKQRINTLIASVNMKNKIDIEKMVDSINSYQDLVIIRLSLYVIRFKEKICDTSFCLDGFDLPKPKSVSRLSQEFDRLGVHRSYRVRARSSLITFRFFECIESNDLNFKSSLFGDFSEIIFSDYDFLRKKGLS